MAASGKVSLKLLINTKSQQVLFAEAGKDFVDFLFQILSLPVGSVINLLTKNSMVGCLGNLYDSIEKLSDTYIQPNQSKDSVLKPKVSASTANFPLLLPDDGVSMARKFYMCNHCYDYVADEPNTMCPNCNRQMSRELSYVAQNPTTESLAGAGGFVKGVVTYMVMDDLSVNPMSTISSITMLNKFNVIDVGALEEKVVSLGMNEGLKLLKASLQCKNVLTSVFLA